jgi:hypothetical protein
VLFAQIKARFLELARQNGSGAMRRRLRGTQEKPPMIRVAGYAPLFPDNQRDASIEDQLRICGEKAEREKTMAAGGPGLRSPTPLPKAEPAGAESSSCHTPHAGNVLSALPLHVRLLSHGLSKILLLACSI